MQIWCICCAYTETQIFSLVLYHVIVSLYRGFIQPSIFRLSRHCTTLCTLCICACVMNCGWCSVVSIVLQLRASVLCWSQTNMQNAVLTRAELSVVLNDSWAACTACRQTFEYSWKPRPGVVRGRLPAWFKKSGSTFCVCYVRYRFGWKCCWSTLKCTTSVWLPGGWPQGVCLHSDGTPKESRPSGT